MKLPWSHRQREADLDAELSAHLRMAVDERVARGEDPTSALYAARRELGNLGLVKEVTRGMWGGASFERLGQDIRYGARTLRRSRVFTIVAGLTLALGIGATTAVFTVVNGVLLRPLPYPHSDRLVRLSYDEKVASARSRSGLPDFQWVDLRRRARLYDELAAATPQLASLTGVGDAARFQGAGVTAEFFRTVGVPVLYGRAFTLDEETPGNDHVVILGHGVWTTRFGSDPRVIGRVVTLDGIAHTVVGVMPRGFAFPYDAQLWRPLAFKLDPRLSMLFNVTGRLREGVTVEQAAAELEMLSRDVAGLAREAGGEYEARVVPLKTTIIGNAERSLLVFAGAVALVLLIACANVANLLLMRATSRQREMAVRSALGAGRSRLVRQLVTESALLWVVSGLAGSALSVAGVRALLALAPEGRIPRQAEIGVDGVALGFALVVALVTGLVFGLAPALRATRTGLRDALAATSRTTTSRDHGLRGALVVSEIALALVLLAGAGLLVRSFVRMRNVEIGFRPEGLATMTLDLPDVSYRTVTAMLEFHDAMLDRLTRTPGVASAVAVNYSPFGDALVRGDFQLEGGRKIPSGFLVAKPAVSPGYFRTMGIRLLRGREFTAQDDAGAVGVVIVSKTVADRIWPGVNAVGQRIAMKDEPGPNDWLTVVGVVDDVELRKLDGRREAAIYQPYRQLTATFFLTHMTFIVRATDKPEAVVPSLRDALREIDRAESVASIGTMDAAISATVAEPLFQARLIGVFSAFALLLAGVGIYGVVAYSVAERTHEIGIRVALGAARGDVVRMVLRRVLVLVVPGVIIGVVGALLVTRVLSTLLFDVKPNDPVTLAGVAALLVAVAFVAGLIPARRATRVDPLVTLRAGG